VNHTSSPVSGQVTAARSEGKAIHVLPEGAKPVEHTGNAWPFELPGFTGTLFEWRHT
jgi:hypothetical protein